MISKPYRFTSRLFDRCFKRSRKFRAGKIMFLTSDTKGSRPHFSVVVGTKYSKKAVIRNRLRRQLYEIIRKRVLPYFHGKNVICLYNGDKNGQNSSDLQKSFFQFLSFMKRVQGAGRKRIRN